MLESEQNEFKNALITCFLVKGFNVPNHAGFIKSWFAHFEPYPLEMVKTALHRCSADGVYKPSPASVMKFLPDLFGHPGPEEAFNCIPKSESEAGFVTDQMMMAYAAAEDSINRGDMVAARLAFIETYQQAVNAAKAQNQPARFWYSDSQAGTREQRLETKAKHLIEAGQKQWISKQSALNSLKTISNELGREFPQEMALIKSSAQSLRLLPTANGSSKTTKALPPSLEPSNSINGKINHLKMLIEYSSDEENKKALQAQLDQLKGKQHEQTIPSTRQAPTGAHEQNRRRVRELAGAAQAGR